MLGTIIICYLVADLLTGLVHWWEDCYGLPTWRFIGKAVIVPNIDHHRNPGLMGSMAGFIDRNYQGFLLFLLVVLVVWILGWITWPFILTGMLASTGNEVHLWSHRNSRNKVVQFLQDAGLVQSPHQHAKHHKPPYDCYYCTIGNVTNAILERIYFWRTLEWIIKKAGISPKRMTAERDFY